LEFLSVGQLKKKEVKEKRPMKIGRFSDLKVHVAIRAHEEPLVFESPLQTDDHRLPGPLL
jgi:hypothetical protein